VIKSFADKVTAAVFAGLEARRMAKPLQAAARRKLMMLDAATSLDTLRATPGNRLEALKRDRKGQHISASTSNGGCASSGKQGTPGAWKSWTITEKRA